MSARPDGQGSGMSVDGVDARTPGLGRTAARGGAATLVAQVARIAIQMASIVVLARLLGPTEYGLVAMVTAIVGFASILQDFGLSRAAIQARVITRGQRDNLFWLNLACGVLAGGAVFLAAPAVARLYDEPLLVDITRWLALSFVMGGLAAQARASLLRNLRFAVSASTEVIGPLLGLVVAVVVASSGGSYWALVGQQLVSAGVVAGVSMIAAGWLPGLPKRHESVRSFVSYGVHLLGAQVLTYASSNADSVVVGARFGAAPAGLYDRAFQMMMMPIRQLTWPTSRVAMPVLARLQDDADRFSRFLVRGQTIVLNATMPVLGLAAALGAPVVEILLGRSWLELAPLFTVLAVGGAFQIAGFAATWVLVSTGNTKAQFRFALVSRPLVVVAVVVGSFWGVTGVAAAYALAVGLSWPASVWWAGRAAGMAAREWFLNGARAIVAHGTAAVCAGLLSDVLALPGPWAQVGTGAGAMLLVLGVEALVWPAFRRDLAQFWRTKELLSARPRAGDQAGASSRPEA
ncbi:lipopolysaccharide biosynthesis protein [Georgenia alba]|uniref:Lipopolysaccharide biosynthesis protein n=1 Tax=Georgenia alba TaxID=2233858 RepID=A0ABW2QB81_9MICO